MEYNLHSIDCMQLMIRLPHTFLFAHRVKINTLSGFQSPTRYLLVIDGKTVTQSLIIQ